MDYRRMTRQFLLGESQPPSLASYIHSVSEVLQAINPRTKSDSFRIETAKAHLKEIRRHTRRLQERLTVLEEQVRVLEESKE